MRPLDRGGGIESAGMAGVLTWHHRITRVRERCTDLFGRDGWRWRVIRTSNAYVFRDPKAGEAPKSENPTGTLFREASYPFSTAIAAARPVSEALNKALTSLGASLAAREGLAAK